MNTISNQQRSKTVTQVITSTQTMEGAGFSVRRPFPTHNLSYIDPFLLLDHMEPMQLAPGKAKGAPDHPHRGFETVTYLLEGQMQHKDSAGNRGLLKAGDVQWMTAGSGVVHSEMPSDELLEQGGTLHGFQIWVNLPAHEKMISPRYQDMPSEKIPVVKNSDQTVSVKVIAGESLGSKAVIDTKTPIVLLHFKLEPEAAFEQEIPKGFNTIMYVIEGEGNFGPNNVPAGADQLVVFDQNDGVVSFSAKTKQLSVLLLAGLPLNEPVARYGPFVMNTKEQIMQAINDYQNGVMGAIK